MAAVNVTNNTTTHNQTNGARALVRNSAGTPYVVMVDEDATGIQVWKGNSTTPTSFTEQDAANAPASGVYGSVSAAIDSTDILHIVYMEDDGKTSACRYVTFDADGTTDTFAGDVDVDADIGSDPTSINNLYTAIAIDANDIPHIAYTRYDSDMGADYQALYYNNRIGGAWNGSGTAIVAATANVNNIDFDIVINADNIPQIANRRSANTSIFMHLGNANDATGTWTSHTENVNSESTAGNLSMCVDSDGDTWIAYHHNTDNGVELAQHVYGNAWTTWTINLDSTAAAATNSTVSVVADGTDIYIFYEDANHDIYYNKYTGSWAGATSLETGTYNTAKAKWAFWVDNDSGGALISTSNPYFDGSDAAASDPDAAWNNETNADDGLTTTNADTTTSGSKSTNYIEIQGTNATGFANAYSVRARIHATNSSVGSYVDITAPSGGWTLAAVQGLEARIWRDSSSLDATFEVYAAGDAGGTSLGSGTVSDALGVTRAAKLELEVVGRSAASELDYTFTDEVTNEEDIHWNTLSLAAGSASLSPSLSPSISPSISPSVSPSQSPSASLSPSISPSVSPSQSPSASFSPSISPSLSPSISPSPSPSQSPSASLSPSVSPSQSPSASFSPSISPSPSPSQSPSASLSPSLSPSISPSPSPSQSPSASFSPSISPSPSPSQSPSASLSPSVSPSQSPSASFSPSISPSVSPSQSPSASLSPSVSPSLSPSISPSPSPSQSPSASLSPSLSPSISPSPSPSVSPSASFSPSISPSPSPSQSPSASLSPSLSPSISPSVSPSQSPSASFSPSISPSSSPSQSPSASLSPSISPSVSPSASFSPSISPSPSPSQSPSASFSPSVSPSVSPSASFSPSISPSPSPSQSPSASLSPSVSPSFSPSISPSPSPSQSPSASLSPSISPSPSPSVSPSASFSPSISPSPSPSFSPSVSPSFSPSISPSPSPSLSPSISPSQETEPDIQPDVGVGAGGGKIPRGGLKPRQGFRFGDHTLATSPSREQDRHDVPDISERRPSRMKVWDGGKWVSRLMRVDGKVVHPKVYTSDSWIEV